MRNWLEQMPSYIGTDSCRGTVQFLSNQVLHLPRIIVHGLREVCMHPNHPFCGAFLTSTKMQISLLPGILDILRKYVQGIENIIK